MRFFVTGVCGQLGHDVMRELSRRGHEAVGSDIAPACGGDASDAEKAPYVQLDITDRDAVRSALLRIRPDAVVHCAAWTAVDLAEEAENADRVWAVNAEGTRHIAQACKALDCKMTYLSTDYVFSGEGSEPWKPESEAFAPLNVYGRTKLAGERAVKETLEKYFIVRTAWVFGVGGRNFVSTMIGAGKTHESVRVVCDQIGTPTYTPDLARLLVDMNETERYGVYHATNEGGYVSWYDFCREIYRQYALATRVVPVSTQEYGLSRAARPKNSRLDKSKLAQAGFTPLPAWQDAVRRYLQEARL